MDFAYLPSENHGFLGSRGTFPRPFRPEKPSKNAGGTKSAQMTSKNNINSLQDALGVGPGRKKKLWKVQRGLGKKFQII